MNNLLTALIAVPLVFLGGCGGMAPLMSMPEKPQDAIKTISATVKPSSVKGPEENAVQLATHAIKQSSSVVINVPANLFETKSEVDAKNQEFKTNDFFNEAEQEIEKVFINRGFRVLSRAKFEAKLRDLRDEARCKDYKCLYSQAAPELRTILDDLKLKFDRKEIGAVEYSEQIKEFSEKMKTASAGKARKEDEKELTDISEVIRAAQSGDTRADYILQINVFKTKNTIEKSDLRQLENVREFFRNYPDLTDQLNDASYYQLSCAVVKAELNAKLIHVQSGEIIWIGNYDLNDLSAGVNQLKLELGVRTYASNEENIRNFVRYQNSEAQREARYNKQISILDWQLKHQLMPVAVVSGRCDKTWSSDAETRTKLAREVAKGLISTIKVN